MAARRKAAAADEFDERILPHNLEAEKAVLGAMLVNPETYPYIAHHIGAPQFFRRAHRVVFEVMAYLIDEKRVAPDLISVVNEVKRRGELEECGGPAYISALTDGVPRAANVQQYARIVKEKALLRSLITTANAMLAGAYDEGSSATELLNEADKHIVDLQRGTERGRLVDLRHSSAELFGDIEYQVEHKGELTGVDTGFDSINALTLGWQKGDLVVVAARPSIGKTAFTLNTINAPLAAGKRVAFFSLEMRRKQLERRMLSQLSGVQLSAILSGYLGEGDLTKLSEAITKMSAYALFVDDRGGQTVGDIRAACRRLRAEGGLDLVVVDYVQLVPGSLEKRNTTRNEEMTDISRRLKALADEVDVPVLCLSQLNRAGDARGDHRPRLTDLRESGALEQDADLVCFLHRKHHRESGTTQFIVEKQRNGAAGAMNLTIIRETQTFVDGGVDVPEAPPAEEKKAAAGKPRRFWKQ